MTIRSEHLERLLQLLADEATENGAPLQPDRQACFPSAVHFERARFVGPADFTGVTFRSQASFDQATFEGDADFRRSEFCDHADFDNVTFQGPASFRGATFNDHAGFQNALFADHDASFISAKFRSYVDFEHASIDRDLKMSEATFQLARRFGPLDVGGRLELDDCVFSERITIEALAGRISTSATTFADGVRLSVAGAELTMDCVDFGELATVSRLLGPPPPADKDLRGRWAEDTSRTPRLLTLQGAQVASLSISGIDLRGCRFFGAHGLESVVIEPSCQWRRTPRSHLCIDREILAEEQQWRAWREGIRRKQGKRRRVLAGAWRGKAADVAATASAAATKPLKPMQLAALYRALRKASEDNNDQAGASDFYYGEMEMRRLTPIPDDRGRLRAAADRIVIVTYWLLAGYGLRAWRSLGALIAVVAIASVVLWQIGFREGQSLRHASRIGVASATSLVRPVDDEELNGAGFGIEIFLRFSGPVLVALSALAIRARIKR